MFVRMLSVSVKLMYSCYIKNIESVISMVITNAWIPYEGQSIKQLHLLFKLMETWLFNIG